MGTSAPRRGLQDHNCGNNADPPTKTSGQPWSRCAAVAAVVAAVVAEAEAVIAAVIAAEAAVVTAH